MHNGSMESGACTPLSLAQGGLVFLLEALFAQCRGLLMALVALYNRYFLAVAVEQLAIAENITVIEFADIPGAQDAIAGSNEYRLLIGVTGPQMVEQQVEQDGHDRCRADAGVENGLEPGREVIVEVWRCNRDHAEAD